LAGEGTAKSSRGTGPWGHVAAEDGPRPTGGALALVSHVAFLAVGFQRRMSRSRASFSRRVGARDGKAHSCIDSAAAALVVPRSKGTPWRRGRLGMVGRSRGARLGKQLAAVGAQGRLGSRGLACLVGSTCPRLVCSVCGCLVYRRCPRLGPRLGPRPVRSGGGRQGLESGKIGMPQADLQPSAPSPLAPLHASASGVPPRKAQAGATWVAAGGGQATWVDMGGHGFVDGIRSPLHTISCGPPKLSFTVQQRPLPRSLRANQ
jgi:hypothetical protein